MQGAAGDSRRRAVSLLLPPAASRVLRMVASRFRPAQTVCDPGSRLRRRAWVGAGSAAGSTQILLRQVIRAGQHHRSLHGVHELAHVARPAVAGKAAHGLGREPLIGLRLALGEGSRKCWQQRISRGARAAAERGRPRSGGSTGLQRICGGDAIRQMRVGGAIRRTSTRTTASRPRG